MLSPLLGGGEGLCTRPLELLSNLPLKDGETLLVGGIAKAATSSDTSIAALTYSEPEVIWALPERIHAVVLHTLV